MKKLSVAILSSAVLSYNVIAAHCNINFNYGVVIDPQHLRMVDHGQTIIQINNEKQLFVQGKEINLTEKQAKVLATYTKNIRTQVPQIVSIAIEGVDISLKTVNKIIGGLTGENSAAHQKIQEKFSELQERLRLRFNQSDKNFYIAPQDFDDFDEIITGNLEGELQNIVANSVGTILTAVGDAITTKNNNDNENSTEQRVTTLADKIEKIGETIEIDIEKPANALNEKTIQFCKNLQQLNQQESMVQKNIPILNQFNLISVSQN